MERDQAATSPETDVDSTDVRSREPAFNLPPGLTGILSFLIAVHVLRTYVLPAEIDQELILNFAFLPVRYTLPLGEQGLVWLWTPVTYSFLHGSWEHLIFNVFWMVAFGAPSSDGSGWLGSPCSGACRRLPPSACTSSSTGARWPW